jgi:UDP-N-acetylmuramyl pentapeptide phosphotransferase/UDP-N-acetylglucosamine-1-phosphate transferase
MIEALVAFLPSLALGWLILHFRVHHEKLTGDTETRGPQKIHTAPVPRIGGLMIFAGFIAGVGFSSLQGQLEWEHSAIVVLCALPAFAGGFYEDVTKHGSVLLRLAATFVAAGLAFWLLGARLDRLDFPQADALLAFLPLSLLFTMFAAGGVSQSMNIIDGLNGLAVFVGIAVLGSMGLVAWRVGDALVLNICMATVGGMLGFFVWNFPRGKIFCGDGGAYFIGFVIAEVSVLLVHRHREVSAWFPLVLAAYPIWETMFSIYRRRLVTGKAATQPDALHLHSLVYRWVTRLSEVDGIPAVSAWRRNAISAALCWIFPLSTALVALLYWDDTLKLTFGALAFAVVYVLVYRALANKRNWRRIGRRNDREKTRADAAQFHRGGKVDPLI